MEIDSRRRFPVPSISWTILCRCRSRKPAYRHNILSSLFGTHRSYFDYSKRFSSCRCGCLILFDFFRGWIFFYSTLPTNERKELGAMPCYYRWFVPGPDRCYFYVGQFGSTRSRIDECLTIYYDIDCHGTVDFLGLSRNSLWWYHCKELYRHGF